MAASRTAGSGISPAGQSYLLKQYKLLGAVIDSPWATRLDHKVARVIIDRYYASHGNSRASLRFLEHGIGATRTNIIESIRRLTDHGVIEVFRLGIGTRPTEYGLLFAFAEVIAKPQKLFAKNNNPEAPTGSGPVDSTSKFSSGPAGETSKGNSSGIAGGTSTSGPVGNTPCGPTGDTSSASSGPVDRTESYLRNMSTDMLTVSRIEDTPAVPTAPPVSGQEADPAASAVDPEQVAGGFQQLWDAFPRKHQLSKAKATYKELDPDATLHAMLVARALEWSEHYRVNNIERKWWTHLHTWLAGERYLEDLPEPYEDKKEAAIAKSRERGPKKAADKATPSSTGLSPKTPVGTHTVTIIGSDFLDGRFDAEKRLQFSYRIQGGSHHDKEFSHTFKIVSANEDDQMNGQSAFADIRKAAGMEDIDDTSDLHGCTLKAKVNMGRIEFMPT